MRKERASNHEGRLSGNGTILDRVVGERFLEQRRTRLKELPTRAHVHDDKREKLSPWKLILLQGKINGPFYRGEELPEQGLEWPKNT